MSEFIVGVEHVEVPHDKAGLCPDCLDREITGRGGGKVQLVERHGKMGLPSEWPESCATVRGGGTTNSRRISDGDVDAADLCLYPRRKIVVR